MIQRGIVQAIGTVMQAAVSPVRPRLYARKTKTLQVCTIKYRPNQLCPCGSGRKFKLCCQRSGRIYVHEIDWDKMRKRAHKEAQRIVTNGVQA